MARLKYFAKQTLPDPTGVLSREVPSSAIVSVNEVQKIASSSESSMFGSVALSEGPILEN